MVVCYTDSKSGEYLIQEALMSIFSLQAPKCISQDIVIHHDTSHVLHYFNRKISSFIMLMLGNENKTS